jgi:hypothetical protein
MRSIARVSLRVFTRVRKCWRPGKGNGKRKRVESNQGKHRSFLRYTEGEDEGDEALDAVAE